jgi:hypothetical protein
MTHKEYIERKKFINELEEWGYDYYFSGDYIVVSGLIKPMRSTVILDVEYLPNNVEFGNKGDVVLKKLIKIPEGTKFSNNGRIKFGPRIGLDDIPETVVFGPDVEDVGNIREILNDVNIPGIHFIRMLKYLYKKGLVNDFPNDFPA